MPFPDDHKPNSEVASTFSTAVVFVGSLSLMLLINFSYLRDYFSAGLPAGWDSSGHFVMTQLYTDSYWPSLEGTIPNFFQGMQFPRFYPPLFYLICGVMYKVLPFLDRIIIFKLFATGTVLALPGLLGIFGKTLGFSKKFVLVICIHSCFLLSSGDGLARYSLGLGRALEMGLVSQALGGCCLLLLLVALASSPDAERRRFWSMFQITIFTSAFLLSNFHVIVAGSFILGPFVLLLIIKNVLNLCFTVGPLLLGAIFVAPWYITVFVHRDLTPAVPVDDLILSAPVFGLIVVGLIPLVLVQVFGSPLATTKQIFCTAALCLSPFLLTSAESLNIPMAWQPERLWAVFNLFLPIYLTTCCVVLASLVPRDDVAMKRRIKLGGLFCFLVLFITFEPLNSEIGSLTRQQTISINALNIYLKSNPLSSYALIPFNSPDRLTASPLEIALSHYIALSGQRAIWSIFRESSFNSIFATNIRNFVSSTFESYGIPQRVPFDSYSYLPLHEKLQTLGRWGIGRVITTSASSQNYQSADSSLVEEYKNDDFSVLKLTKTPVMQFTSKRAFVFLGKPTIVDLGPNETDFASIAEFLATNLSSYPPVLMFKTCQEIQNALKSPNLRISCNIHDSSECCTDAIRKPADIFSHEKSNHVSVLVNNQTATENSLLIAAPWRDAKLVNHRRKGQKLANSSVL